MCFQQALASHAKAKLLVQNYQLKQLERAFADTHLATRLGLSSSCASAAHKFPMAVPNLHLASSGKGAEATEICSRSLIEAEVFAKGFIHLGLGCSL